MNTAAEGADFQGRFPDTRQTMCGSERERAGSIWGPSSKSSISMRREAFQMMGCVIAVVVCPEASVAFGRRDAA